MSTFLIVAVIAIVTTSLLAVRLGYLISKKRKQMQYVYPGERKAFQRYLTLAVATWFIVLLSLGMSFM